MVVFIQFCLANQNIVFMYMLWFVFYGSVNFFINSLVQYIMIYMGLDYKGLIINFLWVIQYLRYIIYIVNEYIFGKFLLIGLYVYNIYQEYF